MLPHKNRTEADELLQHFANLDVERNDELKKAAVKVFSSFFLFLLSS
jgi:hypothetical protein